MIAVSDRESKHDIYHMVCDTTVYQYKQQRLHISTGILMMSCFGCQPVSIFDTRVLFQDEGNNQISAGRDNKVLPVETYRILHCPQPLF